jgi:glutathione S-transferase
MLTVHHLGVSQSERIVWLCEELEIPYLLKRYDRVPPGRGSGPPELKALHPLGTAPIISDGELILAESAAIIEYLIVRYGGGRLAVQPEQPNYADYLYWFHFANGSFMPNQVTAMYQNILGDPSSPATRFLIERSERPWRLVEERLAGTSYLAGDAFTAADIIMGFPLTTMRTFLPRNLGPYPHIAAYLARIGERAAYRRAMEKAEPGMTPLLT